MRPHTHTKPKPLLPVAGKAVLDHVLDALSDLPITEYIFITGHLKEQIEEHIKEKGLNAQFIEQKVKDGPAGAIKLAEPYVDEDVLIIYVDTVFDADLSIIKNLDGEGIIWAQEVEDYQRFGIIVPDEDGNVKEMVEKPSEPIGNLANIALYYVKDYKLLFEGIHYMYDNDIMVQGEYFLTEAFMHMVRNGAKLKVAEVEGWYDCGKPETTLASNAALLEKRHQANSESKDTIIHEPVFIGKDCEISGAEIGPHVSIADGCVIKNAKLSNMIVDKNSEVTNITVSDSIIGENASLEGSSKEQKVSVLLGDDSVTEIK